MSLSARARWDVALALVFLAGVGAALALPPTADIAWRHHIARLLLDGAKLYTDAVETNPPLWFWGALPSALLERATGLPAYLAQCLIGAACVLAGAAVLDRLLAGSLDLSARRVARVAFVAAVLLVPVGETGQREQSSLMACILWVALAAERRAGRTPPWALCAAAALFAAWGFALKHYFVLVPVAVEVWLIVALRRAWQPFRVETVILGTCALAYAAAVLVFSPRYLTDIAPLVGVAYHGFGPYAAHPPWLRPFMQLMDCAWAFIPFGIALATRERRPFVLGLLGALAIATIIVLLQTKGWRYHQLAAQGLGVLALAMMAGAAQGRPRRLAVIALTGFAIAFVMVPLQATIRHAGTPVSPALKALIRSAQPDTRLFILSVAPEHAFYALDQAGRPSFSRHYGLWMLPGLLSPSANHAREALRLKALDVARRDFVNDVMCAAPHIITAERGQILNPGPVTVDTLGFLRADPVFDAWFARHYQGPDPTISGLRVWRAIAPDGPPPVDERCVAWAKKARG